MFPRPAGRKPEMGGKLKGVKYKINEWRNMTSSSIQDARALGRFNVY